MRPLALLALCVPVAACAPEPPTTSAVPRAGALAGGRFVVNMAGPAAPGTSAVTPAATSTPAPATSPEPTPPLGAATPTPDATATPTPAPTETPRRSGGGGSGSRPKPPAPQEVRLVDELGAPVEGAGFRFGDGTTGTTDAAGSLGLHAAFAGNRVSVTAPGFMTSEVFDLPFADALHLRRSGGVSPPFDRRTTTVAGVMTAPPGFIAGYAEYSDPLGTAAPGRAVAGDGSFSLTLTTQAAGEPRGSFLGICGDGAGGILLGVSAPFRPFLDPPPPAFTMVPATRVVTYTMTTPPGLAGASAQLVLYPPDAPRVVFDSSNTAAGSFTATADGALRGGTWRVTTSAADGTGARESVVSARPNGANQVAAVMLAPTTVSVDDVARQVSWTGVPGAVGYRVTMSLTRGGAVWEAFTTTGRAVTVPEAHWPAPGRGVVTVEAIDAPSLTSRSLASLPDGPRRLRIDPWLDADSYRVATTRKPI